MALFECPERIIVMREQQMSPLTGFSSLSHKTHALSISNQTLGLRVRAQNLYSLLDLMLPEAQPGVLEMGIHRQKHKLVHKMTDVM